MNRKGTLLFIGLLIISQVAIAQNFINYDSNRNVKSITLKKATSDALKDCYILQLEESVTDTPLNTLANTSAKEKVKKRVKQMAKNMGMATGMTAPSGNQVSKRHCILLTSEQYDDIKRAILYDANYFLSKTPAVTFTESQLLGENASQTIESALAFHKSHIKQNKSISIADSCMNEDCPQIDTHHVAESFQLTLDKKNYYFIMGENIERNGTTAQWDIIHLNTTRTGNEAIIKVKKAALSGFFSRPQTMVP